MGLLDFASNLGKKLFGSENEAPAKIKSLIEEDNPGIDNLDVAVKDGVVSLSGTASSAEALEKAVLIAGNNQGISSVNVDGVQAPAVAGKVEYYEIHQAIRFPRLPRNIWVMQWITQNCLKPTKK